MFSTNLLRVIVLQADLEVHSLGELPLLVSAGLQHGSNTLVELISGDLTHLYFCKQFIQSENFRVKVGEERITFNNCAAHGMSSSLSSHIGLREETVLPRCRISRFVVSAS